VESLTDQVARKAWTLIEEVEKLGGMTRAIETGLPKMRIEEAAAKRQARIDSGRETIVGVNKYAVTSEQEIDVLVVDNAAVREKQLARLAEVRARRNSKEVEASLNALTHCAEAGEGNLLELAVNAARKRATLGEISSALEKVFGRYQAVQHTISGVYSAESRQDGDFVKARKLTDDFAKSEGRRPRILVAKMGQDGHDRGQKVVASAFADLGFDVDIGSLFQTPEETARAAVENDVHIVGANSLAAGHLTLVPALRKALADLKRPDILVVVGGVIPPDDYPALTAAGAAAIFGPGTVIADAAIALLDKLEARAT
jgi:methylmalonyl-CoA mutase